MAVRDDFTAGEVLAAADLNDTFGSKLDVTAPVGKILQVIYGTSTTAATSTSATFADTNLSATITPTSATSKVLVMVAQSIRWYSAVSEGSIRILRDSTSIFSMGQNYALVGDGRDYIPMLYLDSPNTTSATTYKTQFNRQSGTIEVQANSIRSTIVLMEVGA
jgi:hypothetical protein